MRLFRRQTYLVLFFLAVWVCGSCHRKPRTDELSDASACYVAEIYYGYLKDGKAEEYVSFVGSQDSMPEGYRTQMVDLMKQYVANLQRKKGGILEVQAAGDTIFGNEAQVFLDVLYGDSSSERVDMLLYFENKQWRMY